MATVTSNIDEIGNDHWMLGNMLRMTRYRRNGKSNGEHLLDFCAQNIQERVLGEQTSPDGSALAPNKEPYASSKDKAGKPIGVLYKVMLDIEEVKGTREYQPDWAEMEAGKSDQAKNEFEWFTEGRKGIQEPRPIYDLDDRGTEALWNEVDQCLEEEIVDLGGEAV